MTYTYDQSQEYPFEQRGISRDRRGNELGVVVYRYKTAEDRETHLREEARVLQSR